MVEIKLNGNGPLCHFTQSQLEEIVANLCVSGFPAGGRVVAFGMEHPIDTSLPWQQTNQFGENVGMIKYFRDNRWQ